MKLNKLLTLLIVLAAISLPVFAGGGSEADMEGKTVVRFWRHHAPAFNDTYDALAEEYMAANPDVAIVFEDFDYDTYIQTLQTAFPAGTEADIMGMFGTWVKSYSGRLAEVPASLVTADEVEDLFVPSTVGGYVVDGKLYGVPLETNIEYGAVLVNTEIAAASGADVSGFDDWGDFITEMKKMTEYDGNVMMRAGYGFAHSDGIAYTFLSLINQLGGSHMNAAGTAFNFDTPEAREALELMIRFVDEGLVDPVLFNDEENWAGDGYFTEVISSVVIGPWVIGDYSGDFPEVAEVSEYVALPSISADPEFTAASGWGLTVSANSEVSEAAWDVVEYFSLNAENALNFNINSGTIPALLVNIDGSARDKLLAEVPFLEAWLEILPYGTYQGHMPDSDLVVYDILYNNVLQALQGNVSVDEAVKTIQADCQETL